MAIDSARVAPRQCEEKKKNTTCKEAHADDARRRRTKSADHGL